VRGLGVDHFSDRPDLSFSLENLNLFIESFQFPQKSFPLCQTKFKILKAKNSKMEFSEDIENAICLWVIFSSDHNFPSTNHPNSSQRAYHFFGTP
jgi:hypothetical protein